jgi:hypothetical protein
MVVLLTERDRRKYLRESLEKQILKEQMDLRNEQQRILYEQQVRTKEFVFVLFFFLFFGGVSVLLKKNSFCFSFFFLFLICLSSLLSSSLQFLFCFPLFCCSPILVFMYFFFLCFHFLLQTSSFYLLVSSLNKSNIYSG